MQSKSVKAGWILMLILGVYRVIASIILVAMGFGSVTSGRKSGRTKLDGGRTKLTI